MIYAKDKVQSAKWRVFLGGGGYFMDAIYIRTPIPL